jgi:integrase
MTLAAQTPKENALTNLSLLGAAANQVASDQVFMDYRSRKAPNTLRRHDNDLASFADYLTEKGASVGNLASDPQAWQGVTWGLVKGFVLWLLNNGFAMSTVNFRLSAVKVYAGLAAQAGALDVVELAQIRMVRAYGQTEGKRINERRQAVDLPTRKGSKKAQAVSISLTQARKLKSHPDTPQGRRDALLIVLLLELGLRVGEVARLCVGDVDLEAQELTFYRPKVDKTQTHRLDNGLLKAARAYLEIDALASPDANLLRGSVKGGVLCGVMSERAITKRVRSLGEAAGLEGLSAHDCRHFWATNAARSGTAIDRLQDAGGWSSHAMPMRYIEAARVANQGVLLTE